MLVHVYIFSPEHYKCMTFPVVCAHPRYCCVDFGELWVYERAKINICSVLHMYEVLHIIEQYHI